MEDASEQTDLASQTSAVRRSTRQLTRKRKSPQRPTKDPLPGNSAKPKSTKKRKARTGSVGHTSSLSDTQTHGDERDNALTVDVRSAAREPKKRSKRHKRRLSDIPREALTASAGVEVADTRESQVLGQPVDSDAAQAEQSDPGKEDETVSNRSSAH